MTKSYVLRHVQRKKVLKIILFRSYDRTPYTASENSTHLHAGLSFVCGYNL